MKHRHGGGLVRYRTRRGNIRHRERPMHPITRKHKREGRRGSRRFIRLGDYEDDPIISAEYISDDAEYKGDIIIRNMPNVDEQITADIIGHEELHRVLDEDISEEASRWLDRIQDPETLEFNPQVVKLRDKQRDAAHLEKFTFNKITGIDFDESIPSRMKDFAKELWIKKNLELVKEQADLQRQIDEELLDE